MYCKNSYIFKIKFKIEILTDQVGNGFGICTKDQTNDFVNNDFHWHNRNYYIMWHCKGFANNKSLNGLLCGFFAQKYNIFYKNCQFITNSANCSNDNKKSNSLSDNPGQ